MRLGTLLIAAAALVVATGASAETQVKIGVLNDRSGVYADLSGEGLSLLQSWRSRTSKQLKRA